jgi:hypothetical protein
MCVDGVCRLSCDLSQVYGGGAFRPTLLQSLSFDYALFLAYVYDLGRALTDA